MSSNQNRLPKKLWFPLVLVFAFVLFGISCQPSKPTTETATATPSPSASPASGGITPQDIPAGFGYPGDRPQLQAWADAWQIDQITQHTWDMWAGMTADSGQSFNGSKLPYWETWCGTEEVFGGTCGGRTLRPGRPFRQASQLTHIARLKGLSAQADTQVVSFNKFNPSMSDFLKAQHAGPGTSGPYNYTSVSSLISLNQAWPANTPTVDRKIEESPYKPTVNGVEGYAGIETKPVIFLVKASGLTPMPLWLGPSASTNQNNPTPNTWTTCVLLDPANPGGPDVAPVPATPAQIGQKVSMPYACTTYLYAPLATIYSFKMDATDAAAWNSVQGNGGTASAGDYGVLGGMHVNSKEIVNWTWQTFWWQPGQDTPNNFPGSKAGMTANVKGTWRNYASCTAYNQTQGKASTKMVVCFNPFLETSSGIPSGLTSNCMSCHGTATAAGSNNKISTLSYPPDYTKPISFGEGSVPIDPRFAGFTRTDFSWAIPVNAK
ncbi:MAG TPA: hypothetical protein VI306_00505 [Pyrinomonadaceae bacterium]